MLSGKGSYSFRAEFSAIKLAVIELTLLALCVLPNLPGFGVGLHYTSALYGRYSLARIAACAFLGLIFCALLPLLFRAISGKPALEVSEDELIVCNASCVSIKRADITSIDGPDWQGVLQIRYAGGKKTVSSAASLYRDRAAALRGLRQTIRV